MGFSDHKIANFTHRISNLPDQPNLSPQELKACFDSSPEELRAAHNAVCDEGEALAARIDAYRAQTFAGEITRDMLAEEVTDELDGKAEQADLTAEAAARAALAETVAQKCEVYFGTYIGDGQTSRLIELGFTPKAVLVMVDTGYTCDYANGVKSAGGLAVGEHGVYRDNDPVLTIAENGFQVYYWHNAAFSNQMNKRYMYLAFR